MLICFYKLIQAATLEGLNPEAISPEEDFTSLSEEEEGEIKNYEKRKKLNKKKKELQRKVKELERQVGFYIMIKIYLTKYSIKTDYFVRSIRNRCTYQ